MYTHAHTHIYISKEKSARVLYGSLEGGLRHRSIGTLVTSAEPRAERFQSLGLFFIPFSF